MAAGEDGTEGDEMPDRSGDEIESRKEPHFQDLDMEVETGIRQLLLWRGVWPNAS